MAPPFLFVFGLGYSARFLVDRLRAKGWRVAGTTRDDDKAYKLHAAGITSHLFDRGRPLAEGQAALQGVTHLLSSIPPDEDGDPVIDQQAALLRALPDLQWAGYLSTTGVYGDCAGAWVDETAPPNPTGPRSQRRLAAEQAWQSLGLPLNIFRLPGIYGPGRNALLERLSGRARVIEKPGHFFSRIHVEDIAAALEASLTKTSHGLFNIADDEPAPQADVMRYACQLMGLPLPPVLAFDEARQSMSPMALSFWADNRRVANGLAKQQLGWQPQFPSYREGLQALLTTLR